MAVPVIASGSGLINNASATTITFTKASDYPGVAVGDLLVVSMFLAGSSAMTPTLPTNWAIPTGATVAYDPTWATQRYVAYRVVDAADVAAASFTFDVAAGPTQYGAYAIITRITGANATTPVNGTPTGQLTTTGTTGTFSSVTTTIANCLVFLSGGLTYSSGSPPTGSQFPNIAPTGTTLATIIDDDPNLGYMGTAYYTQASAGATGTKTVAIRSLSSSAGILQAITVAFAPATQDGAGSSSGTGAAAGVSQSTRASAGASAGTSSVTAVSGSIREAVGSAAGVGAAAAVGTNAAGGVTTGVGAAAGVGAATGVSQATKAAVGSSAGVGAATGVGATVKASVGSSSGVGAATAVAQRIAQAIAAAAGVGAASAVGGSTRAAVGAASGVGSALGVAYVPVTIISAVGSAAGLGLAVGVGFAGEDAEVPLDRMITALFEDRTITASAEDRTITALVEDRTITAVLETRSIEGRY